MGTNGSKEGLRGVKGGRLSPPFKIGWNCPSPLHWRPWAQNPSLAAAAVVVAAAAARRRCTWR